MRQDGLLKTGPFVFFLHNKDCSLVRFIPVTTKGQVAVLPLMLSCFPGPRPQLWLSELPKPRKSDSRQRSNRWIFLSGMGSSGKVGHNRIQMLSFCNLPAGWVPVISGPCSGRETWKSPALFIRLRALVVGRSCHELRYAAPVKVNSNREQESTQTSLSLLTLTRRRLQPCQGQQRV